MIVSITDSWEKSWVYSKHPGKEFGKFVRTAGNFFNDEEADKGNYFHFHRLMSSVILLLQCINVCV